MVVIQDGQTDEGQHEGQTEQNDGIESGQNNQSGQEVQDNENGQDGQDEETGQDGQDVHAQDDPKPVTPSKGGNVGGNVAEADPSLVTPDNKRKENPNDEEECVVKKRKVGKEKESKIKQEQLLRLNKRILHALSLKFQQEDGIETPTTSNNDADIKTPSLKQRRNFKRSDGADVSFATRSKGLYTLLRKFNPDNGELDMSELNGIIDGLESKDFEPDDSIVWSKCRHLWANKLSQLENLLNDTIMCFPDVSLMLYIKNR